MESCVTTLSSEDAAQLVELDAAVRQPPVRYRVYTFVTRDQRAMAQIAQYVESHLYGDVIDVLDGSISDGALVALPPIDLIEWINDRMGDRSPRVLVHADAVLSTWMNLTDHRVWWTQLAMIEQIGALYVLTARHEAEQTEVWGYVDSIWIGEAEVRVYAPTR